MRSNFLIRPAKPADLENLSHLVNSAYRGDSSKQGWTTEADLLDGQRTDPQTLRTALSDRSAITLLLFDGETLLACVYLQNKGTTAYLGMLTVKPDLQGSGIGRQLLESAEAWVRANWRLPRIEMTVIKQRRELIAWYQRRGYIKTNRTEPFPYGDERFGIPKVEDLEFVILEKSI